MFLFYDFNVGCFYICADFLLMSFRALTFGITWRHLRTSSVGSNYIMLHFLYCYKTSCAIVYVANNYCMDGLNWILVLFLTCGMHGSFSYKCVVEINVLFKCEVLIM